MACRFSDRNRFESMLISQMLEAFPRSKIRGPSMHPSVLTSKDVRTQRSVLEKNRYQLPSIRSSNLHSIVRHPNSPNGHLHKHRLLYCGSQYLSLMNCEYTKIRKLSTIGVTTLGNAVLKSRSSNIPCAS